MGGKEKNVEGKQLKEEEKHYRMEEHKKRPDGNQKGRQEEE